MGGGAGRKATCMIGVEEKERGMLPYVKEERQEGRVLAEWKGSGREEGGRKRRKG